MTPHLRIARPTTDIYRVEVLYAAGLGLVRLSGFADHDGFDGVILGWPRAGWHLEFTYCRTHPVLPTPTAEDLLVLYAPDNHAELMEQMREAGFEPCQPLNPWWTKHGETFRDFDGYQTTVCPEAWAT